MQKETWVHASKITKAAELGKRLGGKEKQKLAAKRKSAFCEIFCLGLVLFVFDVLGTKVLGINWITKLQNIF